MTTTKAAERRMDTITTITEIRQKTKNHMQQLQREDQPQYLQ